MQWIGGSMCLATVYAEKPGDDVQVKLLDKVQFIDVYGDELECTNLFGEVVRVTGAIACVDFGNSTVTIRT